MIYQTKILTNKNTLAAAPLKTELKLVKGLLYQFDLYFPPGPSGLVGVAVFEQEVQIYPRNRGEWFTGDNTRISFRDLFRIESEMSIFTIHTYNIDTDYNHEAQILLGILSAQDLITAIVPDISFQQIESEMDTINTLLTDIKEQTTRKPFVLFPNRRP